MNAAPDDPKIALRQHLRAARGAFVRGLSQAERDTLERDLAHQAAPVTAAAPACRRAMPHMAARSIRASSSTTCRPCAFPRVSDENLFFHRSEWTALRPGFGNIPEPEAQAPLVTPDLMLVPLVAATPAGLRLGQGGGYYDRTLARLRAAGPVIALGLAWDVQIVAALPADPWDERLDWIATPTRLVECARYR